MIELNKIYNEDCLETMRRMADNSVDLIVTSPPYNNGHAHRDNVRRKKNGGRDWRQKNYDCYADNKTQAEYEDWQREVISECLRILKPSGNLFYNHKDILKNGCIVAPTWVYQFKVHQQIVWNRKSSVANDVHYFQPNAEYVYWIVKDTDAFYFDKSKAFLRQSVWDIPFEVNTKHPAPFPERLVSNIVAC